MGNQEHHLYELGPQRERQAIVRWLAVHSDRLFPELGVSGGCWWCGVCLPNRDLFGETAGAGDVDLIVGCLSFDLNMDQWRALEEAERGRLSTQTHPSHVATATVMRAVAEGHLLWPPDLLMLAACEVKASWYSPTESLWKASQIDAGKKVKGKLRRLLGLGFNSVSFLHLGATKPLPGPRNPWFQAMTDAHDALCKFPEVYEARDLPRAGYLTAVIGAVGHKTEGQSGAGGLPITIQKPEIRIEVPTCHGWRLKLQHRLAELPKPCFPKVVILACYHCKAWFVANPHNSKITCPNCTQQWPCQNNGL